MPAVKTYTRVNFQNYPSTSTPLNATNLNKMDKGIDDLDDEVVTVKNAIENMSFDADSISYDNTSSGLQATDVQDAVDEINDNLAQTPITVGGETLSTIDDKLNFLIEGAVKITIPVLSSQTSGSGHLILNFKIDTTQYSTLTIGELAFDGTITFTIKDQNSTTLYSTTTAGTAITVNISTATSITIKADANATGAWCTLGNITLE